MLTFADMGGRGSRALLTGGMGGGQKLPKKAAVIYDSSLIKNFNNLFVAVFLPPHPPHPSLLYNVIKIFKITLIRTTCTARNEQCSYCFKKTNKNIQILPLLLIRHVLNNISCHCNFEINIFFGILGILSILFNIYCDL